MAEFHTEVAVVGAAGYTGRFVVAELHRLGFSAIEITRETAPLDDAASLDRAIAGVAAVINCAGPFLDTAQPVIEAALRAGIHYLDVTAEQQSALTTFEHFDAPAQAGGIVVLPACGFYGGLGDLLVSAALGDWSEADDAAISILLNRWWPTKGTRRTGERNTYPRVVLRSGTLQPFSTRQSDTVRVFPEPFGTQEMVEVPLAEAVLVSRHLPIRQLRNLINKRALQDIGDPKTPPPQAADELGRSAQTFFMEAVVRNGTSERALTIEGRDIYAVSASMLAEAAWRIVGGAFPGGCFTPAQIFPARDFLSALPLALL